MLKVWPGLLDEPRSGAPRRIGDHQVEAVIVKTLESTPRDATHWSLRSMAAAMGMTPPDRASDLESIRPLAASQRHVQVVRLLDGTMKGVPAPRLIRFAEFRSHAFDAPQPGEYTPESTTPRGCKSTREASAILAACHTQR